MPRNPYAARLREVSSFVFNDQDIFAQKSRWPEFFLARMGRPPRRLILEIGCSNAIFLTEVARSNPDNAFIGIDWKFKIIYKGARHIERAALTNVVLLRGRAQEIAGILAPGELDEIWVFFPDPWAKKSQLKHRLIQEPFLSDAHDRLKPGGKIFIKTDHPGYFQWVLALFGQRAPDLPEYGTVTAERSRRGRQIEMRRPETESLPAPSARARSLFRVDFLSIDYWRDHEQGVRRASDFADHKTLFEKSFVKDALPIYYLELVKQ